MGFELLANSGAARRGRLKFHRGHVQTPAFMPVGTYGSVKAMRPEDVRASGAEIILGNTFHLMLRPGADVISAHGGLHGFMHWDGPILTDSGGFQVWSLADLRQIDERGVTFASPVNGDRIFLGPEESMAVQRALGSDIVMCFDECTPYPAEYGQAQESMLLSMRWAERSSTAHEGSEAALFGIAQGGMYADLRRESAEALVDIGFDGYAIGGLSVGEPEDEREAVLDATLPHLPADRPRYLMGVGTPRDFFDAIASGIDLFDCVTPTRNARNHTAFTSRGRINVRNRGFQSDPRPLDPACDCVACTRYGIGTLRHLCTTGEMLGGMLLSLHNLRFFHRTMERIREAIPRGELLALREEVVEASMRRVGPEDL